MLCSKKSAWLVGVLVATASSTTSVNATTTRGWGGSGGGSQDMKATPGWLGWLGPPAAPTELPPPFIISPGGGCMTLCLRTEPRVFCSKKSAWLVYWCILRRCTVDAWSAWLGSASLCLGWRGVSANGTDGLGLRQSFDKRRLSPIVGWCEGG